MIIIMELKKNLKLQKQSFITEVDSKVELLSLIILQQMLGEQLQLTDIEYVIITFIKVKANTLKLHWKNQQVNTELWHL